MNLCRGKSQTSIPDTFKAISRLLIKESRLEPLLKNVAERLKNARLYDGVFIWTAEKADIQETAWGTSTGPLYAQGLFMTLPQPACIRGVATHGTPLTLIRDEPTCSSCPVCPICPGWASLVIPLLFKGEFYGILFVTLPSEVIAVNTEVAFLVEVGENIAACLNRMNQEALHRTTATALLKRSLELEYFHNFARITEQPDTDLETILQRGVDLIPASMDRPDLAAAALVLNDTHQRFTTPNFTRDNPMVENPIFVDGKAVGVLTVCYPSPAGQGPELTFLKEEEKLLGSISLRMGKIIERKRGRIALERSEQRFRDLTNNAVTGIAILQDQQIVFQNPEYTKIFGPLSHSPTLFLDAGVHPDDKKKTRLFHETITRYDFTTLCVDFRIASLLSQDGTPKITSVFCRAAMTEFREKPAVLLNVMDMTKPRELENLLRIQDKMTSLGRVAAGIAHEIRNPLSGINIYLKSLEKYALERNAETEGKIISKIQSASNRIESVIKRVMDFSKPGELKPISVDVNKPVQNAIDLAAVTLRKSGVKIETDLGTALPLCRLDSPMIEQVMLNLITNAAEAMKTLAPGTKTIAITTQCLDRQQVVIQVEDSGPGISQIHRERIFDPFYTTKNSSGIGLSICQRIINDHKGTLNLHKSRLGGAGFMIQIPVKQQEFKPAKGV
ncbi:two-component sensory box histidine kinase/response regulator [Desulforapulum autotrophicum HRM2]|uniref:histidine kinase n=1 Tax=Desulforapulum autotrophicum (strain ATCC 43914 / DSM 3382 / VKM B-1955 / HRM2) TaxID=177437 RepID=C0QAR0_DESAH|nr:sensor histidine kinase [Desulforapulum autotrophicum]ACN16843.1 two-component sensory box histidine kinase/response regulator [Desulforapulum autotrophicum HRM2]